MAKEKAYGLSADDVRVLKDIKRRVMGRGGSRRPTPTRRRHRDLPGSGGGRMLRGDATSSVSGGDFSVDNVEMIFGADPRTDPEDAGETVAIVNDFEMNGDNGALCVAVFQQESETWLCIQLKCPAPPP